MNAGKTIKDYEALFDEAADRFEHAPMEEVELYLRNSEGESRARAPSILNWLSGSFLLAHHSPSATQLDFDFDLVGRRAERWALCWSKDRARHATKALVVKCTPCEPEVSRKLLVGQPCSTENDISVPPAIVAASGRSKNERSKRRSSGRGR